MHEKQNSVAQPRDVRIDRVGPLGYEAEKTKVEKPKGVYRDRSRKGKGINVSSNTALRRKEIHVIMMTSAVNTDAMQRH